MKCRKADERAAYENSAVSCPEDEIKLLDVIFDNRKRCEKCSRVIINLWEAPHKEYKEYFRNSAVKDVRKYETWKAEHQEKIAELGEKKARKLWILEEKPTWSGVDSNGAPTPDSPIISVFDRVFD